MATPNRNSSPTYRWATPFTHLRKGNSLKNHSHTFFLKLHLSYLKSRITSIISFDTKCINNSLKIDYKQIWNVIFSGMETFCAEN
ncbi:hypothetical protein FT637_29365 [Bacillus cereus]|nr:hypothetical protein [Bacillus cereus]